MLQYMGHPGVVWRVCLEADGKDIVAVVACDVQVVGAGLVMLQVEGCQLKLGNVLGAKKSKSVELAAGLRILRQLREGSSRRGGRVAQHGGSNAKAQGVHGADEGRWAWDKEASGARREMQDKRGQGGEGGFDAESHATRINPTKKKKSRQILKRSCDDEPRPAPRTDPLWWSCSAADVSQPPTDQPPLVRALYSVAVVVYVQCELPP